MYVYIYTYLTLSAYSCQNGILYCSFTHSTIHSYSYSQVSFSYPSRPDVQVLNGNYNHFSFFLSLPLYLVILLLDTSFSNHELTSILSSHIHVYNIIKESICRWIPVLQLLWSANPVEEKVSHFILSILFSLSRFLLSADKIYLF